MILTSTGESTRDLVFGKYDSPMALYLHDVVMMAGDFGADEWSDGEGHWSSRYGRRFLHGDDRGFVYCTTMASEEDAIRAWSEFMAKLDAERDADDDEIVR